MAEATIIPFRRRRATKGNDYYDWRPMPLRPRYRPFHQPLTRARHREGDDTRTIWQMLSPEVAEFLLAKLEQAQRRKEQNDFVEVAYESDEPLLHTTSTELS